MSNDGPNILYLILKIINPYTRIGVSNIKYEIEKSTLYKYGNDSKYILDDISSNYTIIIDNGGVMMIMLSISPGIYCQGKN